MTEEDVQALTESKMRRLRNLRMFRGKTDDEIKEFYRQRRPKKDEDIPPPSIPASVDTPSVPADEYKKKYQARLKRLQAEYGVDLNNSNDAELLKMLVQHLLQQDNVNEQIQALQQMDEVDTRTLKNLGDFQRSLVTSIADLQVKLGISRQQRKEKQIDDVVVWYRDLKKKAKEFFDGQTVQVRCVNCDIEMARYWLNFPKLTKKVVIEAECWKCHEKVVHAR